MSDGETAFVMAAETAEGRSGKDRRTGPRRAPQRPLDPLFAATLVNQIAAPEMVYVKAYAAPRRLRAGIAINVRA